MSARGVKIPTFDRKLKEGKDYWVNKLSGKIEPSNLRLNYERPVTYQAKTDTVKVFLPGELQTKLARLTANSPMLVYAAILAALKICLHKYTGSRSIAVGSPALREDDPNQSDNAVVLLDEVERDMSFRSLLVKVRETLSEAYARQGYNYNQLVKDLAVIEPPNRCALFDVALALTNIHGELPHVKNDMSITLSLSGQKLTGEIEYNSRLFNRDSIERFKEHLLNVLYQGLSNVDLPIRALDMLAESERHRILVEWNSTARPFPADKCMHHLFEAQAERTPLATAAAFEAHEMSYRELNRRANQIAHYLQGLGVGPEVKVGIFMDRSLDMLAGLLGIIKAGGAFVPLDPTYPKRRLAFLYEDAAISVLLTEQRLADSLPDYRGKVVCLDSDAGIIERQSAHNPTSAAGPDNLAYVIYTSGSTGRPKGVAVAHGALVNFSLDAIEQFALTASDRVLQFASMSFDVAIEEITPALLCGAAVIMRDQRQLASPADLTRVIYQERVTVMELPTAYWQEWVNELSLREKHAPPSLRLMIVGGENASAEAVTKWREFDKRLINVYGVTEAAITSTVYTDSADGHVAELPIGRPMANTQIYVLDTDMKPTGVGIAGEMYIGGDGLARGYVTDAPLTAEKFIPNPFGDRPGARLYKTGDLVMYLPDGSIEFIGRSDYQVKVRGFRIELGEIESVLKQHPGIENAVVVVSQESDWTLDKESDAGQDSAILIDEEAVVRDINSLDTELAEQLFADVEQLSDDEAAATLAMEMQLKSKGPQTKIRRFNDFDIMLTLKNDQFIAPPRESQRNWLVRRALDELADDLISLDEASRRMIPGSARYRLTSEWSQSQTTYDDSQLIIQGQQVMQDWERPLMRAMAEIVTESHGDILELGFGMGISATYIQEFGVRSYTVVEYNDGVVEQFNKWKTRYPGRDIKVIHSRWHDAVDRLGTYDGIFFDTVPSNEEEYMREVIDNVVMAEDIFPIASRCLRKGGVFTWYTNEIDSFSRRHQRLALKYFSSFTIQVVKPLYPPEDCHYWWADSMVAVKAIK
jgi:amino acid adenylation domain-containing protein